MSHSRFAGLCLTTALALTGIACGGAGATAAPAAEAKSASPDAAAPTSTEAPPGNFDFEATAKREITATLAAKHVVSEDKSFEADVLAAGAPTWGKEGKISYFEASFGTEANARCYVYPERIDAASALLGIVAALGGSVKVAKLHLPIAEVVVDAPVMFLQLDYTTKTEKGLVAGMVKLGVNPTDDGSLVCLHDEVGYRESFKQVFKGIVSSSKRKAAAGAPATLRREIALVETQGTALGFLETQVRTAPDGGRMVIEITSAIIPTSPTTADAHDDADIHIVDAKGTLLHAMILSSEGGEQVTNLTLERTGARAYSVAGTFKKKEVKATFASKAELTTEFAKRAALHALPNKAGAELKYWTYVPGTTTSAATEVSYRADGSGQLAMKEGDDKATVKLDAKGLREELAIDLGDSKLTFRRVVAKGEP